jgi:hypothetical protein
MRQQSRQRHRDRFRVLEGEQQGYGIAAASMKSSFTVSPSSSALQVVSLLQ